MGLSILGAIVFAVLVALGVLWAFDNITLKKRRK